MPRLGRRTLLKAGVLSTLAGSLPARAAPPEKSAVVLVWFDGGFSSIFSAANAYLTNGWFNVTSSNIVPTGGGIFVDQSTFGALPSEVVSHMGVVGSNYGWSDHVFGASKPWQGLSRTVSNPVALARAMGGTSPVRYVHLGSPLKVAHGEAEGVFCTALLDLSRARALVQGTPSPTLPDQASELAGLQAMHQMSQRRIEVSPQVLAPYSRGIRALSKMLAAPPLVLDWNELAGAYGLSPQQASLQGMAAKFAAAELMVRYGTDVVSVTADNALIDGGGWDSHGDHTHERVRSEMNRLVVPALSVFLSRMLSLAGHNVTVAVLSHFARTSYGANGEVHGSTLSAPVWNKYLRPATTAAELNPNVAKGEAAVAEHWAFLAECAGVAGAPFGPHRHGALRA